MAKPDLCNEAERLRLDTRGTKKELRFRILQTRALRWRAETYPDVSFGEIDIELADAGEEDDDEDQENLDENGGDDANENDDQSIDADDGAVNIQNNPHDGHDDGREDDLLNVSFNPLPPNTSTPVGTAGGNLDANMLLQMILRRDEDQRRRDEEHRREIREYRKEMQELRSNAGSGSSVTTSQEFGR